MLQQLQAELALLNIQRNAGAESARHLGAEDSSVAPEAPTTDEVETVPTDEENLHATSNDATSAQLSEKIGAIESNLLETRRELQESNDRITILEQRQKG